LDHQTCKNIVLEMTYTVLSGKLNLTQSINFCHRFRSAVTWTDAVVLAKGSTMH